MKKKRLIPVLLLKNGFLVQSRQFIRHQNLGNPVTAVKRLSEWASDELIYLDISRDDKYDLRRDDQGYKNSQSFLEIIKDVSKETFMPITVGGKIKNLNDIEIRLKLGADKVAINSEAYKNPKFINDAAKEFGSQCIVISIDYKINDDNSSEVFIECGKESTNVEVQDWAKQVESMGAGEILLNSINKDGTGKGYDIEILKNISELLKCPVIACGGVGEWEHLCEALLNTDIDAVAAANIFHYQDQSVFLAKQHLYNKNMNVRKPDLIDI
tara:strand:- start:1681 stop:2490 length:810 start_codon:yes stop_codon:yes gene_type:complete